MATDLVSSPPDTALKCNGCSKSLHSMGIGGFRGYSRRSRPQFMSMSHPSNSWNLEPPPLKYRDPRRRPRAPPPRKLPGKNPVGAFGFAVMTSTLSFSRVHESFCSIGQRSRPPLTVHPVPGRCRRGRENRLDAAGLTYPKEIVVSL